MFMNLFKFFIVCFFILATDSMMGMETPGNSEQTSKLPTLMEMENKIDKEEWANALDKGDLQKVEKLLKLGADPNAPITEWNKAAYVPLHWAILQDSCVPLMEVLLRYKADPNLYLNQFKNTTLIILARQFKTGLYEYRMTEEKKASLLAAIELLLSYGADIYHKETFYGVSSVDIAKPSRYKSDEQLITLLKDGHHKFLVRQCAKKYMALTRGSIPVPHDIAKIIMHLSKEKKDIA